MDDTLEDRLAAVERALTDGDHDLSALAAEGSTADRVETVEDDLEDLDDRVAELEAATQALRGYVGNVRAVNEEVRERADLALETARATESGHAESEPTISQRAKTSQSDEQRASSSGDSPTLELETDDQTRDDRCPLCESDGVTSGSRPSACEPHPSTNRDHDSRHGLTDGGRVRTDEMEEPGDSGLFASIRALL